MPKPPLVYGYVRANTDQPEIIQQWQEAVRAWCAREGWELGGIFTDVGGALDTEDRTGFCGLLQALALPKARAVVVLHPNHLGSRVEVITTLVHKIRRTASALILQSGQLPEPAQKLCQVQPGLTR